MSATFGSMDPLSDDDYDGFPGNRDGWLAVDGLEDPNSEAEPDLNFGGSDVEETLPVGDAAASDDGFGEVPDVVADDSSDDEQPVNWTELAERAMSSDSVDRDLESSVNEMIDRNFRAAQLSLQSRPIVMPWETGVAAGVFNQGVLEDLRNRMYRPEFRFPVNVPQAAADSRMVERLKAQSHSAFPMATRRIRDMVATDATDLLRSRALGRWKQIVQLSPEASDIGRLLLREVQHLKDDACLIRILNDTVAKKSAGTLLKRSGEILKFVCFSAKLGVEPFPFDELNCYKYLCCLSDSSKAKPTTAASFRSAVAFCLYVFGFDGALSVLESKRSQGIAHVMKSRKAPLKQKRPFTVAEIIALERFVSSSDSQIVDAIFVGHILFCIFSRSRWGDHQSIERLQWDLDDQGGGFVQGDTRRAKTSVTAEQKTRFLPLTAPLVKLGKVDWWVAWKLKREEAGLVVSAAKPFLPAPASDGTWCLRAVSAGEASAWIREILKSLGFNPEEVGSHSCKATLLSFCAKAGVSQPNRLLLGYHCYGTSKTMLHYSRDALSGPLRVLSRVLDAIVERKFFPDLTRSGYFAQPAKKVRVESGGARASTDVGVSGSAAVSIDVPADAQTCHSLSSSDSESSDSSAEDSSCDESAVAAALVQREGNAPASGGDTNFVHVRLGTLHKGKLNDSQRLACGRPITSAFKAVTEGLVQFVECAVCFGSRA